MKKFILFMLTLTPLIYSQIHFDGNFESGNLATVTQEDSVTYIVTTKKDIGGRWFYFKMYDVKGKFVHVRIPTSDVTRAMYSYDNKNFIRFSAIESPNYDEFEKTFAQDTVWVSYYTPYTFSYLQSRIKDWEKSPYVKVDTLGFTTHNLPIQEIKLTDTSIADSLKYNVWIHARTHPGETPSSWQFDGIVQQLLMDDDVISYYRKNIVFHMIPFTNPDGVYYGRSRTNYDGVDVESNWGTTDANTTQEVKILKQRMREVNAEKKLSVFINMHSQAASSCTFWIHTTPSVSDKFFREENQFCNLNTSDIPYFQQKDYSHSALQPYFPEGWLMNNYGPGVMALTYETPYDQYSNRTWVTNDNLFELGKRTVYAIAEYLRLSTPKHYLLDNADAVVSGNWQTDTTGILFYGNDYLTTQGGTPNSSVSYSTTSLESGSYDVYAWWPSNSINSYNTKFDITGGGDQKTIIKTEQTNGGEWNYLANIQMQNSGPISVKVMADSSSGRVIADAFRIIYKGIYTEVKDHVQPTDFILYQNYPNPFNPSTTISFNLNTRSHVKLLVYNTLGELVTELINSELSAGQHQIIFDASRYNGLSSGVYYYTLFTDKFSLSKGMVLLK